MRLRLIVFVIAMTAAMSAQVTPDWCKKIPRPAYKSLERVDVGSSWFEVYRVAPDVYAIYEPHQWEEVISYLILGKKRALLFDTGMGIADINTVTLKLTHLPISVINSHTHNDHVGDNWRFKSIYGMETPFTRKNAAGSRADAQEEIVPAAVCGKLPEGFDAKTYATRPFHITNIIHDGSKIDLGGRTIEVIATPGHTPDAISLLDRASGLLFTGDTFYLGPIFLYRPETDLTAYGTSIERLRKLAPKLKLLLPAHNTPTASPAYLGKLTAAYQELKAGKIKGIAKGNGQIEYPAEDFSFLKAE